MTLVMLVYVEVSEKRLDMGFFLEIVSPLCRMDGQLSIRGVEGLRYRELYSSFACQRELLIEARRVGNASYARDGSKMSLFWLHDSCACSPRAQKCYHIIDLVVYVGRGFASRSGFWPSKGRRRRKPP